MNHEAGSELAGLRRSTGIDSKAGVLNELADSAAAD